MITLVIEARSAGTDGDARESVEFGGVLHPECDPACIRQMAGGFRHSKKGFGSAVWGFQIIRFLPDLQNYYLCIVSTPKHMDKIVPLIGSAEVGPLGVLHLPRLWLKVSLDAKGVLANGYPAVGAGFDQMVLDGLGLKKDAVVEFITKNRPTYCQFEAWIKEQPETQLESASIKKLNDSIRGYNHDEGTVQSVLGENELPLDIGIRDAVTLNRIDDWKCFHEAVLK